MLELGIDEITAVLQYTGDKQDMRKHGEWGKIAEDIIVTFAENADLFSVFGDRIKEDRPPKGYDRAYTFGHHDFYFAMAYHSFYDNMGVVAKFSAQAWDYYCENTGLWAYSFLQSVKDDLYTVRLSRIDLTADYIDEGLSVTSIHQNLKDNKIGVFREHTNEKTGEIFYKKIPFTYQGHFNEQYISTLYVGSSQSNSRLRIYDKRREQLERKGSKLDKAKKCHDWVRFEGVFRHDYAHQITDELMAITNDDEYVNMIASILANKYRFMTVENGVVDCETEYTQMLIDCVTNGNFALRAPSSRSYSIARSLRYLIHSSGLVSTLYKILKIWGKDAVSLVLEFFDEYVEKWVPNDDCRYWLCINEKDHQLEYPDFKKFFYHCIETMNDD